MSILYHVFVPPCLFSIMSILYHVFVPPCFLSSLYYITSLFHPVFYQVYTISRLCSTLFSIKSIPYHVFVPPCRFSIMSILYHVSVPPYLLSMQEEALTPWPFTGLYIQQIFSIPFTLVFTYSRFSPYLLHWSIHTVDFLHTFYTGLCIQQIFSIPFTLVFTYSRFSLNLSHWSLHTADFLHTFQGTSHTSDLTIGTPVATLPDVWRYRGQR